MAEVSRSGRTNAEISPRRFETGEPRSKPRHPLLLGILTLATLGGGLLNIASVLSPVPSALKLALLRQLFPLEFLHLSRILTLLIGFALVISSINIHKRKKR